MLDQSQILKEMNLSIQQERADLKAESSLLNDRKKFLKRKETEYLKLSLDALEGKKWENVSSSAELQ